MAGAFSLPQQVRQLCDIHRYTPRLIAGEQMRR
jgi:hypothetical protein